MSSTSNSFDAGGNSHDPAEARRREALRKAGTVARTILISVPDWSQFNYGSTKPSKSMDTPVPVIHLLLHSPRSLPFSNCTTAPADKTTGALLLHAMCRSRLGSNHIQHALKPGCDCAC